MGLVIGLTRWNLYYYKVLRMPIAIDDLAITVKAKETRELE